jgi:hypothetical protein
MPWCPLHTHGRVIGFAESIGQRGILPGVGLDSVIVGAVVCVSLGLKASICIFAREVFDAIFESLGVFETSIAAKTTHIIRSKTPILINDILCAF